MQPATIIARGALVLGAVAILSGAPAAFAESETGFTFKRVKVGEARAAGRRITVQIDPDEQARILAANPAVPPPREGGAPVEAVADPTAPIVAAPNSNYDWYWNHISPGMLAAGPGRLDRAVDALGKGPGGARVAAPRLATLQKIADAYGAEILKATVGTGVSPALALAVIGIESAGRPKAVSHAGAAGLMQLMPATAARFGVTDRNDPAQNIRGGVAYLSWLLERFDQDAVLALAGYNAGEGAVDKHAGVPPYAETRDYVPKVLAAWSVAKGLCLTPPQLVSDGCVFRQSTAAVSPARQGERG